MIRRTKSVDQSILFASPRSPYPASWQNASRTIAAADRIFCEYSLPIKQISLQSQTQEFPQSREISFYVGHNDLANYSYSHAVDKSTGVRSDQTVILTSFESASAYPDALRRVSYIDKETQKRLKFLTNNFGRKRVLLIAASILAARKISGSSSICALRLSTEPARMQ
jgi:hypothetical protein